jgi:FkbM family methyltransferase
MIRQIARRYFPQLLFAWHEYRAAREMAGREPRPTPHGFRFLGHDAMEAGTFEPFESRFIVEQASRTAALVDVGANAGYFVCLARGAGQHVLAVEPLPANVALLIRNLRANHMEDVEIFPVGLSSRPGFADLFGGGTGASLVEHWSGTSSVWKRTVPLSTLDILLSGRFAGQPLTIKVDVEGAEYELLLGAKETLQRRPAPIWLVEVNFSEHHPSGLNPRFRDVFEIFWSNGYEARTADEEERPVGPEDIGRWLESGRRDFGTINYIFEKGAS